MKQQKIGKLTNGDILKWWGILILLLIPFGIMATDLMNTGYMFHGFFTSLFLPYYLPIFIILLFRKMKTVLEFDGETISVIGIRCFIRYTIIKFKTNSICKISFYGKKTFYIYIQGFGGKLCSFKSRYNDEICKFLSDLEKEQEWGEKAKKFKYWHIIQQIIFTAILLGWPFCEFLYHHVSEITNKFIRLLPF